VTPNSGGGGGPLSDPPPDSENPYATPASARPTGRYVLMPGWILLFFAIVGCGAPLGFRRGDPAIWIQVMVHGLPAAIAVLVIAPANLRHGKDPVLTIIAVIVSILAILATLLLIAGIL